MAQSINAKAFTVGENVVFGQGKYAPGTQEGQKLLAHELTHVAQQEDGQKQIERKSAAFFLVRIQSPQIMIKYFQTAGSNHPGGNQKSEKTAHWD